MDNRLDETTSHNCNVKIEFRSIWNTNPMMSCQIWLSTPFLTKKPTQCYPQLEMNHLCIILITLPFQNDECNTCCHHMMIPIIHFCLKICQFFETIGEWLGKSIQSLKQFINKVFISWNFISSWLLHVNFIMKMKCCFHIQMMCLPTL